MALRLLLSLALVPAAEKRRTEVILRKGGLYPEHDSTSRNIYSQAWKLTPTIVVNELRGRLRLMGVFYHPKFAFGT
ncbi:hypothetical protein EV127DRAFT_447456 [Xylaria flabelliformis]|nr:hypothetical protein EV127DRAFT_447456 [Xylaria flabelliformis]